MDPGAGVWDALPGAQSFRSGWNPAQEHRGGPLLPDPGCGELTRPEAEQSPQREQQGVPAQHILWREGVSVTRPCTPDAGLRPPDAALGGPVSLHPGWGESG